MQWNRESKYQQQPQQDVYADVKTAFSGNYSEQQQDNQEFSLQTIQEKLGAFTATDDAEMKSSSPDLMPSVQTINMSYQREYSAGKTRSVSKLSTKQQVMIASYAIVVLALIIGVALCSVYVGNAFGSAVLLDGQYADVSSQVAQLTEQVGAEDYDELMQKAIDLGYTDSNNANTKQYTKVETRPAQNFDIPTNWFDSLCDWLCNAFGG